MIMIRRLAVIGFVSLSGLLTGCGGDPVLNVAGQRVTVRDQLYVSRPTGYFCNGLGENQIKLSLLDYNPACFKDQKQGAADPRNPAIEHTDIELVLTVGTGHPNLTIPFMFGADVSCDLGGADSIATFHQYAAGSTTPTQTKQANSGSIKITQLDRTNVKPLQGSFDLVFDGMNVKGSIDAFNCDP